MNDYRIVVPMLMVLVENIGDIVMPISASEIEARRKEYRTFRWQVDEREPVLCSDVTPGTTLKHWGLPNQSPFLFIGVDESGKVLACVEDGYVVRFGADSWFVAVEIPNPQRRIMCDAARQKILAIHCENQRLWQAE